MTTLSEQSSVKWSSSKSLPFHSPSMPQMEMEYDGSMVAPVKFSQRRYPSNVSHSNLITAKTRSTVTLFSTQEEPEVSKPSVIIEEELDRIKRKLNRSRIGLYRTLAATRYALDKVQYRRDQAQQKVFQRDETIEHLINSIYNINAKIKDLKEQINQQHHRQDHLELKQTKLQRKLGQTQLNVKNSEQLTSDQYRDDLIEEYQTRLQQLKIQQKKELMERDDELERLKATYSDQLNEQSDEYMKLVRATARAFDLESQRRDILKDCLNEYETNIYRATKPCCISTSSRLNQLSTQLRLYSMIETALHELVHSSRPCGKFRRSYQTFLRLHAK